MAAGTAFRGGTNNTTYDLVDGWNGFAWGAAVCDVNAMPIQWSKKRKYDQFYALALILKVEGMHS
jgi:hypothetical protein